MRPYSRKQAMRHAFTLPRAVWFLLLLAFSTIAGCVSSMQASYLDPAPYCAAVGTIDAPDERYTGPAAPDWIVDALSHAGDGSIAPISIDPGSVTWRCAGGGVLACEAQSQAFCKRASTSRAPTMNMRAFCHAFPNSPDSVPVVDDKFSAYVWTCVRAWPHIAGFRFEIDDQGYPRAFWRRVEPGPAYRASIASEARL